MGGRIGVVDFLGEWAGGGMGVSAGGFNGTVVVTVPDSTALPLDDGDVAGFGPATIE
jgi:hypothetical protein